MQSLLTWSTVERVGGPASQYNAAALNSRIKYTPEMARQSQLHDNDDVLPAGPTDAARHPAFVIADAGSLAGRNAPVIGQ